MKAIQLMWIAWLGTLAAGTSVALAAGPTLRVGDPPPEKIGKLVQGDPVRAGADTPGVFQMRLAVPDTPGMQAPANSEKMKLVKLNPATGQTNVEMLYVSKQILLDQTDLKDTRVDTNRFGFPEIAITFSNKGGKHFAEVTRQNIDKRLAIIIDGQVYSAPVIRAEIPGGTAVVTGNFSREEAENLSHKINQALNRKPKETSLEQLRA